MDGYKVITRKYTVSNPMGLDLWCVRQLVQKLWPFEAEVEVHYRCMRADGKSFLDMLAMGVNCGAQVEVSIFGREARQAQEAIQYLFNHAFACEALPVISNPVVG